MSEMIWPDAESLNGRGYKGWNSEELEVNLGPTNEREEPCLNCPLAQTCVSKFIENKKGEQIEIITQPCIETGHACVAFRQWCTHGTFKDEDMMRLLREFE
jgi:hypothetical protein